MEPADEDVLRTLYRSLAQRELPPDDPRYVELHSYGDAFGPDVVSELVRDVSWSDAGSLFYLSGLRGSGKSTQLLRLQAELQRRGFAAVRLESEDYLNLRQPVDVVEFLFFLVGAITDAIEDAGWLPADSALERGWGRLRNWLVALPTRISLTPEAEVSAGLPGLGDAKLSLKAELRADESFVAQLRRFLAGRVSELTDEANRIVADLVAELRPVWPARTGQEWKGLVVLVDSLDHVRGADFKAVKQALVDLLDKQTASITLAMCRTVFIVPPWVHVDYTAVRRVTNIKIASPDGKPDQDGLAALTDVLRRRCPGGELERFVPAGELKGVLADSGGHLRDLLRLVRGASTATEELPFSSAALRRGRQEVRDGMLPLADDEIACLRQVLREHRVPLPSQDGWEALSGLFDRHLVLGYKNGETWYDVHPLIRADVEGPAGQP